MIEVKCHQVTYEADDFIAVEFVSLDVEHDGAATPSEDVDLLANGRGRVEVTVLWGLPDRPHKLPRHFDQVQLVNVRAKLKTRAELSMLVCGK